MFEKDYQKIFVEYQDLKSKTHLEAQIVKPGGSYTSISINGKDLTRRNKFMNELKSNLDELTDKQLKELYQDNDLAGEAVKVLTGRKINNK